MRLRVKATIQATAKKISTLPTAEQKAQVTSEVRAILKSLEMSGRIIQEELKRDKVIRLKVLNTGPKAEEARKLIGEKIKELGFWHDGGHVDSGRRYDGRNAVPNIEFHWSAGWIEM